MMVRCESELELGCDFDDWSDGVSFTKFTQHFFRLIYEIYRVMTIFAFAILTIVIRAKNVSKLVKIQLHKNQLLQL